ncbi:GNAT family N-acetyltransferase [Streptomyces botrytidirepellens]
MCSGRQLSAALARRIFNIHTIAVAPGCRRQGIARKLIRSAERRARESGFQLAVLEHQPELTGFYTRLGYHAGDSRLLIAMPRRNLLSQCYGLLTAAKPLTAQVSVVDVPGAPARIVSGLLPGTDLPESARFTRGQLIA